MRIRVGITIPATVERVWDDVRDLASHVEWMADAEAIRFTSEQQSGLGTTFECDTRIGPFRMVDHMEVTAWIEGRVIGVRHTGLVSGSGKFVLKPEGAQQRSTRFTWDEELSIPWLMGGPLVGVVLRLVWMRNLRRLRRRFS